MKSNWCNHEVYKADHCSEMPCNNYISKCPYHAIATYDPEKLCSHANRVYKAPDKWWEDYSNVVTLTSWMASEGTYDASAVAYAVEKPHKYTREFTRAMAEALGVTSEYSEWDEPESE